MERRGESRPFRPHPSGLPTQAFDLGCKDYGPSGRPEGVTRGQLSTRAGGAGAPRMVRSISSFWLTTLRWPFPRLANAYADRPPAPAGRKTRSGTRSDSCVQRSGGRGGRLRLGLPGELGGGFPGGASSEYRGPRRDWGSGNGEPVGSSRRSGTNHKPQPTNHIPRPNTSPSTRIARCVRLRCSGLGGLRRRRCLRCEWFR